MLNRLINAAAIALGTCFLYVFVLVVQDASQQRPKAIYENKGGQIQQPSTNSGGPWLVVFRVLAPGGLEKITAYCNSYGDKEKKNWPQSYYCDLRITDVYIAVFTGFLALVTLGLIYVGIRQTRIVTQTFAVDKRAFVFASGIHLEWNLDNTTGQYHWRIRPVWQNTGDTATKRLRMYSDSVFRDSRLPVRFQFIEGEIPSGPGMIGPRSSGMGGAVPIETRSST
jgi:hypothetical protein